MTRPVKHVGCTVTGCESEHRALGLCHKHYAQQHRHGTPSTLRPGFPSKQKATPGPRTVDPFTAGGDTMTLEQWKRLRSAPAADVHIVRSETLGSRGVGE